MSKKLCWLHKILKEKILSCRKLGQLLFKGDNSGYTALGLIQVCGPSYFHTYMYLLIITTLDSLLPF